MDKLIILHRIVSKMTPFDHKRHLSRSSALCFSAFSHFMLQDVMFGYAGKQRHFGIYDSVDKAVYAKRIVESFLNKCQCPKSLSSKEFDSIVEQARNAGYAGLTGIYKQKDGDRWVS